MIIFVSILRQSVFISVALTTSLANCINIALRHTLDALTSGLLCSITAGLLALLKGPSAVGGTTAGLEVTTAAGAAAEIEPMEIEEVITTAATTTTLKPKPRKGPGGRNGRRKGRPKNLKPSPAPAGNNGKNGAAAKTTQKAKTAPGSVPHVSLYWG